MRIKNYVVLLFLFLMPLALFAQANIDQGKALFKDKCASCHNKNMKDDLTGPALGGTEERWADFPREDLYAWVRNSQKQIQNGHPRAVELWSTWQPTIMNNFTELSDEDIESILAYVDAQFNKVDEVVADGSGGTGNQNESNSTMMWFLIGGLVILSLVLTQVASTLLNIGEARRDGTDAEPVSLWNILTNPSGLSFLFFILMVGGLFYMVNSAVALGRQQGYAPDQPIKFSHATHAGLQGIDCKYCHDGARRSKHSVIPAASTCMNCHRAVKVGSTYGTAELTKIFASIGYDPAGDKYIPDYEEMKIEDIESLYKNWIKDSYLDANDLAVLDTKGKTLVDEQWDGIVQSLTNEYDDKIQGPIEWVRVHNLPDHVYFSHEQHVTAGKLECQTCHGTVEEMEVLEQHAPLSMGWCINCHRVTDVVGMSDNPYYASTYEKYHDMMVNGDKSSVKVSEIGGLECQKCHY